MMGDVTVGCSGQVIANSTISGNSLVWMPEQTYVGGAVDNSPSVVGNHIALTSSTGVIEFSEPVNDPLIAFWSVGWRRRAP